MNDKRYNLEYWNGKNHIETTVYNVPIAIAKWKAKELRKTTHKSGTFKYIEVK